MIIDGHNDLVLHRWRGEPTEHLDLDAAAAAGFAGGFFALYVPSPPMPDPTETPYAHAACRSRFRTTRRPGSPRSCSTRCATCPSSARRRSTISVPVTSRRSCTWRAQSRSRSDLSNLESWYERGLRSVGLVWSRPNEFAEGVPFRFPSSPDTGGGLTAAGRELVHACNRLGILVDLSHLNEAGFWDVARALRRAARRDTFERSRPLRRVAQPARSRNSTRFASRTASSA